MALCQHIESIFTGTMSEKLCLQWNDFQDNVKSAFGNLRESLDFVDVTLACEDGHQVEAHKVILAAASPFFQSVFKRNKHSHPLIYMRGLKSVDLVAMVDFLYYGEANVYQEDLDSFLVIAEELKLKGLTGGSNDQNELKSNQTELDTKSFPVKPKEKYVANQMTPRGITNQRTALFNEGRESVKRVEHNSIAIPTQMSADLEQLDGTVKSMMEVSQNMFQSGKMRMFGKICKVCGKEGRTTDIMQHIEANHLEGMSLPCNLCDKMLGTRDALRRHKKSHH